MKRVILAILALALGEALGGSPALAQPRAWRCGTEYTTDAASARRPGCRLVDGPSPARKPGYSAPAPAPASHNVRIDSAQQHQRNAETRFVLLEELKKAETRQAELLAQGKPDGREKAAELVRNEGDIAALRRELGRLPAAP
jgi:hypothetical protein